MPVGKGRTGAVPVPGGEMPGRWCGRRAACRSLFPKESGRIWVQNPSSYVAMSRKVPPQAVTSRRRGGNRGVRHLVTNFSTEGPGRGIADCGGSLPKGHRQHCRTGILVPAGTYGERMRRHSPSRSESQRTSEFRNSSLYLKVSFHPQPCPPVAYIWSSPRPAAALSAF